MARSEKYGHRCFTEQSNPADGRRGAVDRRVVLAGEDAVVVRFSPNDRQVVEQVIRLYVVDLRHLRGRVVGAGRLARGRLVDGGRRAHDGPREQGLAAAGRRTHQHHIVVGGERVADVRERLLLCPSKARGGELGGDPIGVHDCHWRARGIKPSLDGGRLPAEPATAPRSKQRTTVSFMRVRRKVVV